jgi:hypothetical protein
MPKVRAVLAASFVLLLCSWAPAQQAPEVRGGEISGTVKSGNIPIPGATVSAAHTLTGRKVVTSTDVDGSFHLVIPSNGRYVVRAELSAFAPATQEVVINPENRKHTVALEMILLSRAQEMEEQQRAQQAQLAAALAGRGVQSLSLTAGEGAGEALGGNGALGDMPFGGAGSAFENATESVSVAGNMGRTQDFGNLDQFRERMEEMRDRQQRGEHMPGGGNVVVMGPGGGGLGGGPLGGAIMMFGGPGGGGMRRFNINQQHGMFFYTLGDSALDARPYSLSGVPAEKSDYSQHNLGATIGGPFKIPKLYDGGTKTFYFLGYFATRASNPYSVFSTVPTLAERGGDFSATVFPAGPNAGNPIQVFDPNTGLTFTNNTIPTGLLNPAAVGLLQFIPEPNQPGAVQNFHHVSTSDTVSHNLNLRLIHNFSGMPLMGMGGGGRGGTRGGGSSQQGGRRTRNMLNFGFNYRKAKADLLNPFPTLGGENNTEGINVSGGYVFGRGRLNNNLRIAYNRNRVAVENRFQFVRNVAGELGISGVSTEPFHWGAPNLSFTNYRGLQDLNPQRRGDETFLVSDFVSWGRGKHNLRFGGEVRRTAQDLRTSTDARGTFLFTGSATAAKSGGTPVPGTGYDFADFLLGLAQQTTLQFGVNDYRFRQTAWSLFLQDDWRVRGNLTLNLGVRYEYAPPFRELNDRLVNLDVNSDFTAAAAVLAGQNGPFTGAFPESLVESDRNNIAPRLGLAWKPFSKTTVRAGYGINYPPNEYGNMVQQLAFQPPFAVTQTSIASATTPLTLQNGFPPPAPGTVTNNYGVDRGYRMGYVQLWNLDVQQELRPTLHLTASYFGSKGTRLDLLRAPNRGPTGLRIPGVQPFLWQTSEANSVMHSAMVRLRKRLQGGVAAGGTYTFSKSIDNASSIGGGARVVAQDDQDLAAERGLSSFDQRHRLTGDVAFELPFGTNRRFLSNGQGVAARLLSNWMLHSSFTIASGTPYTARVLGDFFDVGRGTSGTLRADATGQPIQLDDSTVAQWFNTAAFTLPAPGQFGDAGRNTIIGPGTVQVDMSISKNITIGDRHGVEFRASGTNVFNHANFSAIDTAVNSPSYGRVTAVGTMRRVQLSARYRF